MSAVEYHDPYAPLDYTQFAEVDPALEKSGYLPGKIIAHPGTIEADYIGLNPRQTPFAPGEREQFEAVRQRLDRALQACRVVPSAPQEYQTASTYEASLLTALAKHTARPIEFSRQLPAEEVISTCQRRGVVADALGEPARQGRLAEIRTFDHSGREIREFVGNKRLWMDPLKLPAQVGPICIDDVPQRF